MNLSVCLSVLFPVNMKQNYLNHDPEAYTGLHGTSCVQYNKECHMFSHR